MLISAQYRFLKTNCMLWPLTETQVSPFHRVPCSVFKGQRDSTRLLATDGACRHVSTEPCLPLPSVPAVLQRYWQLSATPQYYYPVLFNVTTGCSSYRFPQHGGCHWKASASGCRLNVRYSFRARRNDKRNTLYIGARLLTVDIAVRVLQTSTDDR